MHVTFCSALTRRSAEASEQLSCDLVAATGCYFGTTSATPVAPIVAVEDLRSREATEIAEGA